MPKYCYVFFLYAKIIKTYFIKASRLKSMFISFRSNGAKQVSSQFSPKSESKQPLKNDTKCVFVKCASGPELVHFTPVFFLLFFKCASGVGSRTLKIKTKTAAQSATAGI